MPHGPKHTSALLQRCKKPKNNIFGLSSDLAGVNLGAARDVAGNALVPKRTGKEDQMALAASNKIQEVEDSACKDHKTLVG